MSDNRCERVPDWCVLVEIVAKILGGVRPARFKQRPPQTGSAKKNHL